MRIQKEENPSDMKLLGFVLVAWTGIEPVTRGFSIATLVKSLAFMRVASEFRVMCDIPCYSQITEFHDTFLFYQLGNSCQALIFWRLLAQ
jgi:hypothetical protein